MGLLFSLWGTRHSRPCAPARLSALGKALPLGDLDEKASTQKTPSGP